MQAASEAAAIGALPRTPGFASSIDSRQRNGGASASNQVPTLSVLLHEDDYATWPDAAIQDGDSLRYILEPFPAIEMTTRRPCGSRFVLDKRR